MQMTSTTFILFAQVILIDVLKYSFALNIKNVHSHDETELYKIWINIQNS